MFDTIICQLDTILDNCDNMSCDNIPERLSEIRASVAAIKLELEELEFQAKEEA